MFRSTQTIIRELSLSFAKVTMLTSVTYHYLKLSLVLSLHMATYVATVLSIAQAESCLMMVYVKRNMLEQLL